MDLPLDGFLSPASLPEALQFLTRSGTTIIAGGTDLIPRLRDEAGRPECLVDISRLDGLRFIELKGNTITIGALTTHDDITRSDLLRREAAALVEASSVIGSPQTRNRGTLGGNIANASPAGDTFPALLALGASVQLVSAEGKRSMGIASFVRSPGETALQPGELIHHVSVPRLPRGAATTFERLGSRAGMAVSVVSAAVAILPTHQASAPEVRMALGAVAPTPIRCPQAEKCLATWPPSPEDIDRAARTASQECRPIDDVRGSASYRRHAAYHLMRRALARAVECAADRGPA